MEYIYIQTNQLGAWNKQNKSKNDLNIMLGALESLFPHIKQFSLGIVCPFAFPYCSWNDINK